MAYDDKCAKCLNIEWDNKEKYSSKDRYWCKEKHRYVEPVDSACYYFLEDKSDKKDGGYQPSGCYITTIVVDILGYEDNCELLNILRNFRETTLKTNPDYLPILFEYDSIGPIIAEHIRLEKDNYVLALNLMQRFLLPCTKLIKEGQTEEAIAVYQNMVMELNDIFALPTLTVTMSSELDLENLGKGRSRIKEVKISEN